jgi:hypothetical protein
MPLPRTLGARSAALSALVATGVLAIPGVASAARVTSLQPWAAANEYLAKDDIDGRTRPRLEPRDRVNHVRKGQWVRIECQTTGEHAYGSNLWAKVGGLYVPDQLLKTYTDGRLAGAPQCDDTPPTPPPPPPANAAAYEQAREAGFGAVPAGAQRVAQTTGAKTERPGIVLLRFFIPNRLAGGRILKGDGRGFDGNPAQSVASRASLFWDTETGRTSLTVDPTHVSDTLPKKVWGVERRGAGPVKIWWPKEYDLPPRIRGGSTHAALPIDVKGSAAQVKSTDLKARGTNQAFVRGDGRKLEGRVSMLNSVTNIIGAGAWSVDVSFSIEHRADRTWKVRMRGNGYPAVEAYLYPKPAGSPTLTLFQRRIHTDAFNRTLVPPGPFLPRVSTGTLDPSGGLAALDVASDLECESTGAGSSRCRRHGGSRLNPLPELIAPSSYTTKRGSDAGGQP